MQAEPSQAREVRPEVGNCAIRLMSGGSELSQFVEAVIVYKSLNGVTELAVLLADGIRHVYPRFGVPASRILPVRPECQRPADSPPDEAFCAQRAARQ